MPSLLSLKMPFTESANTGTEGKHTENTMTFLHMVPIVEIQAKSLRLGWSYYLRWEKNNNFAIKCGILLYERTKYRALKWTETTSILGWNINIVKHMTRYFMNGGETQECSPMTRWYFCFVCLFCFTGEILIVCADAETLDAADQHCRPHTDAHSDVCGSDFQTVLDNETINISTLHCNI